MNSWMMLTTLAERRSLEMEEGRKHRSPHDISFQCVDMISNKLDNLSVYKF